MYHIEYNSPRRKDYYRSSFPEGGGVYYGEQLIYNTGNKVKGTPLHTLQIILLIKKYIILNKEYLGKVLIKQFLFLHNSFTKKAKKEFKFEF